MNQLEQDILARYHEKLASLTKQAEEMQFVIHSFGEEPSMAELKAIISNELENKFREMARNNVDFQKLVKESMPHSPVKGTLNTLVDKLKGAGHILVRKPFWKAVGKLTGLV